MPMMTGLWSPQVIVLLVLISLITWLAPPLMALLVLVLVIPTRRHAGKFLAAGVGVLAIAVLLLGLAVLDGHVPSADDPEVWLIFYAASFALVGVSAVVGGLLARRYAGKFLAAGVGALSIAVLLLGLAVLDGHLPSADDPKVWLIIYAASFAAVGASAVVGGSLALHTPPSGEGRPQQNDGQRS